ncbi:MAG TPA: M42 family metallopeptidase [Saprospiraceae bacterium]|nr:M42 family metallopeptidase [Saprospiraceae bacterium]
MLDIALLSKICELPGAPGYEYRVRNFIIDQVRDYCDEVEIDNLGNVIAIIRGNSNRKVMSAAHMDEISFIVTHIEEGGFVRFHTLGGFDPKTLTAQRVIIHGKEDILGVMGTKPIHTMTAEERNKPVKTTDYFIDTGRTSEELKTLISIGDVITRERSLVQMGNCINAKSLDNRISVYILVEVLKGLKNKTIPFDFYAVFTVQEEVGLRGATTAASYIQPDFAIALDVTVASDMPGLQPYEFITSLGKGTAIKVMDGSVICDYRMVEYMKHISQAHSISYQLEVLTAGGTDTAQLQRAGIGGSIAGAISIPTRYLHQVIEMCNKDDVMATIKLLSQCIINIDKFDWSHKI